MAPRRNTKLPDIAARVCGSTQTMPASPFLNTQAVETWDTWFRWRDGGQLRDLTIESTWQRVATALTASRAAARRPGYKRRLLDAFGAWHLLLDERVLATAATSSPHWRSSDLAAVLNIASFVRAPGLRHASIDHAQIEEIAALAVYALDDAALLATDPPAQPVAQLRVGMIGVADALRLLGMPYESAAAREEAGRIAHALANGCLAGSIALARDQAPEHEIDARWLRRAELRGHRPELIDAAQRYGVRHTALTAITSQMRLACFANGVADALDPVALRDCAHAICGGGDARLRAGSEDDSLPVRATNAQQLSAPAQLRLRAAVQPWIDERIACPLLVRHAPDAEMLSAWHRLAAELDLPPVTWQSLTRDCRNERGALARVN
jgi:ribonucleoside-diphosphate reductase alpha chain